MDAGKNKYEEIVKLLKMSAPKIHDKEEMADKVMDMIERRNQKVIYSENFFDYLFWWVNIGWVRRSLVIASILIVVIFGYQQTIILKRLSDLNRQPVITDNQMVTYSRLQINDNYLNKINYGDLNTGELKISDRRVKRLLKSYKEIEEKYKELQRTIDSDPELRRYVEVHLNGINNNKIKL